MYFCEAQQDFTDFLGTYRIDQSIIDVGIKTSKSII